MKNVSIVFIPGTLCTSDMFTHQVQFLNTRYPDLSVHAVDFSAEASLTEMAQTVIAAVGEDHFVLAGFSMGGMVAFDILRFVGDKCLGLALINSNAHADLPGKAELRAGHLVMAKEQGLRNVVEQLYLPNYLAQENQTFASLILYMAEKCGVDTFENQLKVLAERPESREVLAGLNIPVLILGGDQDGLCPPAEQRRMASSCPSAALYLLSDCGHFAPLEQAELVNLHLANLIDEVLPL